MELGAGRIIGAMPRHRTRISHIMSTTATLNAGSTFSKSLDLDL
jgi:hypothetical protein